MIVVSIDPGVRACGVAVWRNKRLIAAAHVKGSKTAQDADAWCCMADACGEYVAKALTDPHDPFLTCTLVIEFPQTYDGKSAKGDTNDLLQLAGVVAAICTNFRYVGGGGPITVWRPREWKGNVPKEVTAARVDAKISDEEALCIDWPAKSLRHNVIDAIAIGLKFFETR